MGDLSNKYDTALLASQFSQIASNFPNFDGQNAFSQIQQAPGPDFRKVGNHCCMGFSLVFR